MLRHILLFILGASLLFSCSKDDDVEDVIVEGLAPVYADFSELDKISLEQDREIINAGKIVYLDPYVFIGEVGEGIHMINNSNPSNPQFEHFLKIPLADDFAVKGDIIYAQNGPNLVSLSIEGDSLTIRDKKENVFDNNFNSSPPSYRGFFECVDPTKGIVKRWESQQLTNPKCRK